MRYSEEFKNHVVSRLLTGEVTIAQAQEQYGVSTFSLREWRKKALSQAGESSTAETNAQENLQMSKLRLPKGVTYLQAYEAVAAKRLLSETDYGAYCRKKRSRQHYRGRLGQMVRSAPRCLQQRGPADRAPTASAGPARCRCC